MGMISKILARSESLAGNVKSCCKEDPIERLAAEIVIAAVNDWRALVKQKAWLNSPKRDCNFTELRTFFESDWCEFIMQNFEIAPARILAMLESELQEAKQQHEKNKKKRRAKK